MSALGIGHLALGLGLIYTGFSLGLVCLITRHRRTLIASSAIGLIGFALFATALI